MAYIENIALKSTTKKPNGIIIGSVTNTNGVLSNFGQNSYFEIPNGRQPNSTFVIKFTTPSSFSSVSEFIYHSNLWESVAISGDTNQIYTYNWSTESRVILVSAPVTGQTYWVKNIRSGDTNTYYISTNGEDYSQAASFTDTRRDDTKNYPFRLGTNSDPSLVSNSFSGTIDLNGCYLEKNGEKLWSGMDYFDVQRIGGDNFDGQWIESIATINSSFTLAAGSTRTFSLSNYLPDATYDYEVFFELTTQTGSTNGNLVISRLYPGENSEFFQRCASIRTRASNTQIGSNTVIVPVLASNQKVTIDSYSGGSGTGTFGLWAKKYRRIGKNGTLSNYISSINTNGDNYFINGNFLDSGWVPVNSQLYNATLASGGSSTLNLSNILPNDGYIYLCMFSVTATTGSTSGNTIAPRLGISSTSGNNPIVCRHVTRTSSSMRCAGNIRIPCPDRKVILTNSGSASGTITVTMRGYRRIGTND